MRRSIAIAATTLAVFLSAIALASVRWPHQWATSGGALVGAVRARVIYDSVELILLEESQVTSGRAVKKWRHDRLRESSWLPVFLQVRGRGVSSSSYGTAGTRTYVAVPLWPFTIAAAGVALVTFRRTPRHACPSCHYNLSGLPPSACCPECGSPRPA